MNIFASLRQFSRRQSDIKTPPLTQIPFARMQHYGLGDSMHTFRGFFQLNEHIWSIHRVCSLLPVEAFSGSTLQDSRNILTRYDIEDGELVSAEERDIGWGTDPRVVSDGETAYLFQLMRRDGDTARSFYRVIKLPEDHVFDLDVPIGMSLGKNWQPFIRDGKLFIVHGFSPLRVLEVSETGEPALVCERETQLDARPLHHDFSIFRGGSNGIVGSDGSIYGFGHVTSYFYRHHVFYWRISPDWELDLRMSSSTLSLNEMGFQICDPTCFFEFNGQLHLGLALSERDWFHAQKFADLLVTLPEKTPETLFMTAKPYVPGIEATKFSPHSHSIPLLNVSTDVGQKHPFGVLRTHKREGAAVKDLKITRHRFGAAVVRVELHYKAHEGSDIEVGVARLDVPDGQLQTMSIPGSNGEVRHLEFSVDPSALEEPLQLHVDVKPFEIEFKNIRVIYDQIDG